MRKVLALRRRLGKRATTTGLIALPFLATILLFVVAPALGLSSASTGSSSTTTGQSTTGASTGQSTNGDTSTGLTPTTGDTSTTGTDSSCQTTAGDTTTGQTTTTGPGLPTTGQTTTGQTTTTRQAKSHSKNKNKNKTTTTTTTTTGDTSTTSTTPDQSATMCPATPCPQAGPTSTDQTTTSGQTTTSPLPPPPGQTTTGQTTTDQSSPGAAPADSTAGCSPDANSPAAKYSVLNGTVNVATDHERLGSSAFPNFTNGAVDNYYSLARSHVDGSPFAEGTASPGDTGPIGQTAAAGNTQQPQYADARWPGDSASGQATFGNQGGPYAVASASDYSAKAESELASNSASGSGNAPSGATAISAPKGFNGRLKAVLAKWKAKWLGRLHLKAPSPSKTAVSVPAVTIPSLPALPVKPPTLTTPTIPGVGTVPSPGLPTVTVPSVTVPPASAPNVSVPSVQGPQAAPAPSRSLAASPGASTTGTTTTTTTTGTSTTTTDTTTTTTTTTTTPGDSGPHPDGGSLLKSTSSVELDPQTNALVTKGESSLGLVSLGSGQIVLEGIHVTASITNAGIKPPDAGDGSSTTGTDPTGTTTGDTTTGSTTTGGTPTTPFPTGTDTTGTTTTTTTTADNSAGNATYKVSVRVASASIGGVPVTIDQDGVHVAGQGGALPYQQASDALNSALKQAGIRLFMVGPEIKTTDGEETIDATGVHVYFTQPVSPPGAPAQFAEHILGEVYLDSLAVLAPPMPKFDSFGGPGGMTGGKTKSGRASKIGGKTKVGSASKSGGVAGVTGGSSGTASGSFGSSSGSFPSGSSSGSFGSSSQPSASSAAAPTASAAPAGFVSTLKKPVWLLIAFLVWVGLTGVTGWSVWKWRQEGGA